jgi:hypothetical protein
VTARNVPSFLLASVNESAPTFIRTFAAACSPLGPEDVPRWQLCLLAGFDTSLHCQDHPGLYDRKHCGFLDPIGLAAIFPGPNPAGFFYLESFPGEGPGKAPCQSGHLVCNQGTEPPVASLHLSDLPLFLSQPGGCRGKKWSLH